MKVVLKCFEIIKMINAPLSLDVRMAIRFKLNDRKWSETAAILKREKMRLESEIKAIDGSIRILKGLEE